MNGWISKLYKLWLWIDSMSGNECCVRIVDENNKSFEFMHGVLLWWMMTLCLFLIYW